MKINEYIQALKALAPQCRIEEQNNCDKIVAGNGEKEVKKVAVSMVATPEVVRQATAWGADLLVVHEPTFYDHMEKKQDTFITAEKTKLIENSGLTIFRFHDYAHSMELDPIYEGELRRIGLPGTCVPGKYPPVHRFVLDEEMTAMELARHLETALHLKHIRIAGCTDKKGKLISCGFGMPGHAEDELADCDFVLIGEIGEWNLGEMARDYAQLGYNKAFLVMTHIGSEREGMVLLAERFAQTFPEIPVQYFECGVVYSYTDEGI